MRTIPAPPPATTPDHKHRDAYWAGRLAVALEAVLEVIADDTYPDLLVPGRIRVSAEALVALWDEYPDQADMTSDHVQALIRRVAVGERQVTR